MANARRDQKYLGLDTNVLVAYLDDDHPQHNETRTLRKSTIALNPTVSHEAYHTLVFKMKWNDKEASDMLKDIITDENNLFISQSFRTTLVALDIAAQYHLGGRDALIIANFFVGKVRELRTFDEELLEKRKIRYGRKSILIRRPYRERNGRNRLSFYITSPIGQPFMTKAEYSFVKDSKVEKAFVKHQCLNHVRSVGSDERSRE